MRITTQTVDEFIECLQDVESIFDSTVRVSVGKVPHGDKEVRNCVKFLVSIQVSAVVIVSDESGAEYLIDAGEICGVDYVDSSNSLEGTVRANAMKDKIRQFASSKGWRTLPGVISE